jgi:gluconate 5-dehydrogenase
MDTKDLWRLDGQVALVVGGAGGIGQKISQGLAESGARVAVASTSQEKAEAEAATLAEQGVETMAVALDVTDKASINAAVDEIAERWGTIHVMVNLAGINIRQLAEDARDEDWRKIIDINLVGAFLVAQSVGRYMIPQRYGKIVTISSTRSELGFPGGYTAYCASKGGVNMLTRQLATEWAKHNITVNAIAPTYTRTPIITALIENKPLIEKITQRIPMGRLAEPDDMVGPTLFLCSPASGFVTGHVLWVDGGVSATEFMI